jgi:S1-C subfamily serine protease
MARALTFLISVFSCAVAGSAFAAGPFGSIHVGTWKGGAYTDATGSFHHCAAESGFRNGTTVAIGRDNNSVWTMGFLNNALSLIPGETYPIDVTFDGQAQYHLFGKAVSPIALGAPLPNKALEHVRGAHLIVAVMKEATYQFFLNSMGDLLPMIENCVVKMKSTNIANAGDFSILPPVAKPHTQLATSASGVSPPKPPKTVELNGTGFVISTNGHVVTNNHVIKGCVGDVRGNLTGGAAMILRIVSTDETNDLALLQPPSDLKEVATIRGTAIHPGDTVIAIGYPFHGLLSSEFTVTTGIVSSLSGLLNNTRYLQISAAVQPGNSGGPLLDTSGNVVGVVAAKLDAIKMVKATGDIPENINFAIKTGALRDFLDNSVVSYQTAEAKTELKTSEIAQSARAYTMLISCIGKEKE